MAVYNVEDYIEESIQSVIDQDIGFEKNIQLILVNDGSPDNSGTICEKYKKKYPANIKYIKKENGGVSSARNEGMKYVEGKYMNFLDPDDLLSKETCRLIYDFFEEVYETTNIVSIPIHFFEAKQGGHILNYKYKKTRQINLARDYENSQLSASSCFLKEGCREIFNFNEGMKYSEDGEFINKILLETDTIGVLRQATYWYRQRKNGGSAIQKSLKSKDWYNNYLKTFCIELINYSLNTRGYVPKFIQYTIMYDLQWRVHIENFDQNILNINEQLEFMELLRNILNHIDDEIILKQRNLSMAHKIYILSLKKNENVIERIKMICSPNNIEYMIDENYIGSICNEVLKIDFLNIKNGRINLEGSVTKTLLKEEYEVEVELNNEFFIATLEEMKLYSISSLGNIIRKTIGFTIDIPIDKNIKEQHLKVYLKVRNSRIRLKMNLGKFIKINTDMKNSYFNTDKYKIMFRYNSFVILRNSFKVNMGREFRFLGELIKKKNFKTVAIRIMYHIFKQFKKQNIYLFMDRIDKADDNAEHLFKYSLKQNDKIKKYFVIGENFEDFNRMKKYGKVIKYNSFYHKFLLLFADKVISSQGEDGIILPFKGNGKYLSDLTSFKFIFLQHGIIKDNLAKWLNKYNKNLSMFVTSVNLEYESILDGDYSYDEKVVKLTGLPRFDNLEDKHKKQILIMPTWRSNLVNELDQNTGIRKYNEKFKESLYCKTYNNLISNKKLLEIARKKCYKIVFFLHPSIYQQISDFKINNNVILAKNNQSYQKMFNESSILITDYSSVAFDFAYLKKPVLYYQFDRDKFFKGHTYTEGYFNYEKMGFGEICYDENMLIEQIESYIESECKIKETYKKRIESFYKFTDKNNCKRVYEEILKI
nr:CDP-glycerol glycerophosphotransferase family protein [Clostridium botulinum]